MAKIKVTYNYGSPAPCIGELVISADGVEIYKESYRCHSTGGSFVDEWGGEHVKRGRLVWDKRELKKIPEDLRDAVAAEVREVLSKVLVCCGKCL